MKQMWKMPLIHVLNVEVQTGFDMVKLKQNVRSSHKYDGLLQAGERIGKNGKLARIRLFIDVRNKIKHHHVEEQNEKGEWVIVHEEDEPL